MTDRKALPPPPRATSVIVIGMAGSGKTTFVSKLATYLDKRASAPDNAQDKTCESKAGANRPSTRPYLINIDPAVSHLGYPPNVDIRDTVDYTRVMDEYRLGPNGGIITSLNLFTTKFDQVLQLVEKRANTLDHVVLDTPGQIEIFTWSASGSIITDSLASAMPTVLVYVVDTPRTTAPATFMSNMLYACSILYKSQLPFVIVFNKTDVQPHDFALEWMHDFEAFQRALMAGNARDPSLHATDPAAATKTPSSFTERSEEPSFLNSLMNSMSLVLDEFYKNLRAVGVSSASGEGMDNFVRAVDEARAEYLSEYRPALERKLQEKASLAEKSRDEQIKAMVRDMSLRDPRAGLSKAQAKGPYGPQYDGDGQIVDPDENDVSLDENDVRLDKRWNQLDGTYWPTPP